MPTTARNKIRDKKRTHLYLVDNETRNTNPAARKKKKKFKPGKLLLAIVGSYLVVAFLAGGYQIWRLKGQIQQLQNDRALLQEQYQEMTQEMNALQDPEIIERLARESLGMVKNGESIVISATAGKDIPKPQEVGGEITD